MSGIARGKATEVGDVVIRLRIRQFSNYTMCVLVDQNIQWDAWEAYNHDVTTCNSVLFVLVDEYNVD